MNTDWITIGEAADLLQVSRDTLRRWEKRGKIKSYRSPSNRRMYKRPEILSSYQITDISDSSSQTISSFDESSDSPFLSPSPTPISSEPITTTSPNFFATPPIPFRPLITPPPPYTSTDQTQDITDKPATSSISTNATTPVSNTISSSQNSTQPTNQSTYIPNFNYPKPSYLNTSSSARNPISVTPTPPPPPSQINHLNPLKNTFIDSVSQSKQEISSPIPKLNPVPIKITQFDPLPLTPINNWNPNLVNPRSNLDDIEDHEPKDNTVKILKIITAILITILVILAIAIFSIIFMQYS